MLSHKSQSVNLVLLIVLHLSCLMFALESANAEWHVQARNSVKSIQKRSSSQNGYLNGLSIPSISELENDFGKISFLAQIIDVFSDAVDTIKPDMDEEVVNLVFTIGSKALGIVRPVHFTVRAKPQTEQSRRVRENFAQFIRKLRLLDLNLGALKSEISWNSRLIKYSDYESQIITCTELIERFLNKSSVTERIFTSHYEEESQAPLKFYNALMENKGGTLTNLIDLVKSSTRNHHPKTMRFLESMISVMILGAQSEIFYNLAKNYTTAAAQSEIVWQGKLRNLKDKIKEVDEDLRTNYYSQMTSDMIDLMNTYHRQLRSQGLSDRLYSHLVEKYPFRHWFVMVYVDPPHEWSYFWGMKTKLRYWPALQFVAKPNTKVFYHKVGDKVLRVASIATDKSTFRNDICSSYTHKLYGLVLLRKCSGVFFAYTDCQTDFGFKAASDHFAMHHFSKRFHYFRWGRVNYGLAHVRRFAFG